MTLVKQKRKPRIELFVPDNSRPAPCPYVGEISHGFPMPSEDYMDRLISLDEELVRNRDATIYGRVKGDSMIDAGLAEGDILVIDRSLPVENGDIGIFRIDGEFLCKRLYVFPDRVELHAENRRYKPMRFDNDAMPADFLAIGRITFVIHKPGRR